MPHITHLVGSSALNPLALRYVGLRFTVCSAPDALFPRRCKYPHGDRPFLLLSETGHLLCWLLIPNLLHAPDANANCPSVVEIIGYNDRLHDVVAVMCRQQWFFWQWCCRCFTALHSCFLPLHLGTSRLKLVRGELEPEDSTQSLVERRGGMEFLDKEGI